MSVMTVMSVVSVIVGTCSISIILLYNFTMFATIFIFKGVMSVMTVMSVVGVIGSAFVVLL